MTNTANGATICEGKGEELRNSVLVIAGVVIRCKKEQRKLSDQENVLVLRHIKDADRCVGILRGTGGGK